MDNQHPVTPQTCVLKMHTKCEKSQRKIKRGLEKLDGVHSIKIDSKEGRVTVTSTSDPELFIEMLTKAAKQCNLIWEPESPPPLNNHPSGGGNSSHQPPHHHHNHHHHHHSNYYKFNQNPEIAQELQELAKNRTVKTLEVTHSKNIKMTFMDNDEINSNQAHVAKTDMDSEKETMSQSLHSKSPTTTPTAQPPPSRPPPPIPTTMQPQAPPPTMTSQFGNETAKDSGIGSSKLMGYSQDFPLKSPPPPPPQQPQQPQPATPPKPATIMQPPAPQTTRAIHVGKGSRRDSGIGSSSSVEEPIKPSSVTPKMVSPASTNITCGDESCIIM